MDEVFKDAAAEAPDPRLIPGIYNYCHTRCDECAFTDRCLTFRHMREDETRHPDRNTLEHVHANLAHTGDLVKTWCESAGIDFDALREDARSEETASACARLEAVVESDPIHQLAFTYTKAAFNLVSSLDALAPFHEWPPAVREALTTIGWYAGMVSAKVDRALHGSRRAAAMAADRIRCRTTGTDRPRSRDWRSRNRSGRGTRCCSPGRRPPMHRCAGPASCSTGSIAGSRRGFPMRWISCVRGSTSRRWPPVRSRRSPCDAPRRHAHGVRAWLHRIAGVWQRRS